MTTPSQIILTVANALKIDPGLIVSKIRTGDATTARQVSAYLMTTFLHMSSPEVGRHLGDRDHTTVLHAIKKVEKRRNEDPVFSGLIQSIETSLGLMERLEGLSVMSILSIAREASLSRNKAMALSVHEIMALANSSLELWEIAQASGVLSKLITQAGEPKFIFELAENITQQLALITEIKPETNEEEFQNVE